jgi:arylsulfatase A-like enzyme
MVAGLLALWSCGEPEVPRLSGVLITLDTTNAPALDFYGEDRGLTPNLAALAMESVVFERAYTVAPLTLPAHVSMMTGLYPLRHGVRENGLMQLSPEAETLAERAREAGFETAAFVAAVVLSSPYGLDQGFELYDEPVALSNQPVPTMSERSSQVVTNAALAWLLARDQSRPFFLWVHYFDPHMPYGPPREFVERAKGNLYQAEVAAMDHDIGRLLDGLRTQLGLERVLVAVVADHGEALGRHGEPTHSAFCYQETIQVPLLLRFPDGRRSGTRSQEVVSVVDLFPTFLGELGLGAGVGLDGTSLALEPGSASRGVYVESYSGYLNYGWSPLAGWVDARGKYLHSSRPEFYDLEQDPHETRNLLEGSSVDVSPYREAIAELSRRPRLASSGGVQLTQEQLGQLHALGYAAAGEVSGALPDPLDPSDRPAPIDRTEQYVKFTRALGLAQAGRNERAITLLREVLAEEPGNVYALETLGAALLGELRFEEAAGTLEDLFALGSERYWARACLGSAYEQLGRFDEALAQFASAQRLRPGEASLEKAIERVRAKRAAQ